MSEEQKPKGLWHFKPFLKIYSYEDFLDVLAKLDNFFKIVLYEHSFRVTWVS